MAGLVVGGVSLDCTAFTEGPPVYVGATTRAFDGTSRTSVRDHKRTFTATTGLYGKTTYDALAAAVTDDTQVSVSGDLLVGATLTCVVRPTYQLVGIGTAEDGYNFMYQITLAIEEV